MFALGAFGHSDRMLEEVRAAQLHGGHIVHTPPFIAAAMGVMERRRRRRGGKRCDVAIHLCMNQS